MDIRVIAQDANTHQIRALLSDAGMPGNLRLFTWTDRMPLNLEDFVYLFLEEDLDYIEETDIYTALNEEGIGIKRAVFKEVSRMLPTIRIGMQVRYRPTRPSTA